MNYIFSYFENKIDLWVVLRRRKNFLFFLHKIKFHIKDIILVIETQLIRGKFWEISIKGGLIFLPKPHSRGGAFY